MERERGGRNQRRRRRLEETRTVPQSALANYLIKRCVLGFMSPQEAQQIAAAAKADVAAAVDYVTGESDGFSFEGINRLAAIGGFGRNSQHAWTDSLKLMKGIRMPSPFCFQLAVLFCGEAKHFKQYFILPHALFATFRKRMFGAEGAMERFWEQMQNHPALEDNPVTTRRNWKKRYIPFGLHGDGVPISGVGK